MQKRISKLLLALTAMCISLVAFATAASAAYVTYIVGSGSEGMGTVGISTDGGSTVSKGNVNQLTIAEGTTVILYAYPNSGYSVNTISGFIGTSSASLSPVPYGSDGTYVAIFKMGSDNFIGAATFKENTTYYTITATAETGGTVSGGGTVASGSSTTLTATANDGYVFTGWYNGDTLVSSNASYTVSSVAADATYTAKFAKAVAKVGSTYYASLADAISAVPTDGTQTTVTLLSDADLGKSALTIAETQNVDLDLGGYTLSGGSAYYCVENHGTLVIHNGTVNATSYMGIVGLYNHTTTLADITVNHSGNVVAVGALGGDLIINSGTVINASGSVPLGAQYYNQTEASITVNGGVITGGGIGLYTDATKITITLNGGTFDTNVVTNKSNNTDAGTLSDYVTEGKVITYDGTYYTVTDSVPENAVAKVGDMYYTTLQEAIKAVPTDGTQTTVTLLSDVSETTNLTIAEGQNINLDLSRYTISNTATRPIVNNGTLAVSNGTVTGGYDYAIVNYGTIDLTDVTVNGTGSIAAIWSENGTVNVNGNTTITHDQTAIMTYTNGNVVINGGTVTGALTRYNNNGTITVNGGTFTEDPSAYVAEGTPVAKAEDGTYIVGASNITVTANPTEGGTVSGGGVVISGESVTLTATPAENYEFVGWYDGETLVSTDAVYTVENVTVTKTYTAKFALASDYVANNFEITTDSGYYGEYDTPTSGIIAFNAIYKNYEEDSIESFGLYFYIASDSKIEKVSTDTASLSENGGKFYATVSGIPADRFNTSVFAVPYVVINGKVYSGSPISATVNADKWLGNN